MTGRRVEKPLAPSEASDRRNALGEEYRRRVSEWCEENA